MALKLFITFLLICCVNSKEEKCATKRECKGNEDLMKDTFIKEFNEQRDIVLQLALKKIAESEQSLLEAVQNGPDECKNITLDSPQWYQFEAIGRCTNIQIIGDIPIVQKEENEKQNKYCKRLVNQLNNLCADIKKAEDEIGRCDVKNIIFDLRGSSWKACVNNLN